MSKTRDSVNSILVKIVSVQPENDGTIEVCYGYKEHTTYSSGKVLNPTNTRQDYWKEIVHISPNDIPKIESMRKERENFLRKNFVENIAAERIAAEEALEAYEKSVKMEKLSQLYAEGKLYGRDAHGKFQKLDL